MFQAVTVNGKSFTIRKLQPEQLAYAERNQRDGGLYADEPVYSRYYKPYVLEAGLVGATLTHSPSAVALSSDSDDATAVFEQIIDCSLGLGQFA